MPRRDGTGPMGTGAKTGRGMGLCNTTRDSKHMFGLGRGIRFGFRRRGRYTVDNEANYKEILIEQKNYLENKLNIIKKELEEFEK